MNEDNKVIDMPTESEPALKMIEKNPDIAVAILDYLSKVSLEGRGARTMVICEDAIREFLPQQN